MAAASVFGAGADTVAYTNAGGPSSWWGTGKSETYDVAVRLGPDFKGLEVRSVSFLAEEEAGVAGFSVWMSERLQLGSDKANVPDVVSLPAEVNAAAGNETVFNAEIVNRGALGASSLELEWSAGGDGGRVPVALPQPPASGIYVETKVWGGGRRTSRKGAR